MSQPNAVEAAYEAWLIVREESVSLTATISRFLEGEISEGEADIYLSFKKELLDKYGSAWDDLSALIQGEHGRVVPGNVPAPGNGPRGCPLSVGIPWG